MIYAFVDTNILIRVLSQGKPGCEPELFADLRTLASGNAIQLLVPDVVCFEIDRQMLNLSNALRSSFGNLKKSVNETSVWSEIADAKESVLNHLDAQRAAKNSDWNERFKMLDAFLDSESVMRLPYTADIMCRTRIRLMRGVKPDKDQDAAIIESLALFFQDCSDENPVLLFCSENHADFAIEIKPAKDRDRHFIIDPEIAKVLPQTHYFLRLDALLEIDKGYESLPAPPVSSEIAQTLKQMSELEDEDDYGTDEYLTAMAKVESFYDERLSQEFVANLLPSLPDELQARRSEVCDHITAMLTNCRRCSSWDEVSSESKLPQWLEYVPEHMIPYTSLARILRIEESVKRYLQIHNSMDKD